MRTLAITQNITLDGSIEMLGDWFDPQGQGDQGDLIEELLRQHSAADALLVGKDTFKAFRDYWRDLAGDTTGVSAYLNGVAKYVVSSTLVEPEWRDTTVLSGDLVTEMTALKEQNGLDIVCTGSIRLTHALIAAGLVDEYRLFVYPAVQGRGKRLFPDGFKLDRLDLLEARSFTSGISLLRFAAQSLA